MIELFNELAIVGDAIQEEDRVVYLLASLPDSFNTLVTALEASEDVPKMEIVTERLLHAERKEREKLRPDPSGDKAMLAKRPFKSRGPQCTTARSTDTCKDTAMTESRQKKGPNPERL